MPAADCSPIMHLGDYRVEIIPDTEFRLDGGAMFGVVPRVVWERVCPPDDKNRIRLNMNCVFIDTGKEKILIETGIGEKWSDKQIGMYGIHREKPFAQSLYEITGCRPEDITTVINTHLHFDHAGGNTINSGSAPYKGGVAAASADGVVLPRSGELQDELDASGVERTTPSAPKKQEHPPLLGKEGSNILNSPPYQGGVAAASADGVVLPSTARAQFPNARYLVSKNEFAHAQNPHERDRASYLPENWEPLQASGQLELMPDEYEPVPGLSVQAVRGHSETMQTWRLVRGGNTMYGFADLVPTRHHIPPAWVMGYDLYPVETLEFKKRVLPQAAAEEWLCMFYHELEYPLCLLEEAGGKLTAVGYVQS